MVFYFMARTSEKSQLILVLGDQLTMDNAALRTGDPSKDTIFMAEVMGEATYVPHHKKKLTFVFSAMRHFAEELRARGWTVTYIRLNDSDNTGTIVGELNRQLEHSPVSEIAVLEPSEYRLRADISNWAESAPCPVSMYDDDRFLVTHAEFDDWAAGRKQLRMEYFYREVRRKTGLLMDGDKPIGGKWNYDAENRKPARGDLFMPEPRKVVPDAITQDVIDMVQTHFPTNFGDIAPFWFAVTRQDAEAALDHFLIKALPQFGAYQDAMLTDEPFLYHSVIAQYINIGFLDPLAVCRAAERMYFQGDAPLNSVEGFIRQIIGWREYVRGIYWREMPEYTTQNGLNATRKLPDFYWTGDTDMTCVRATVMQTKTHAYAHHIQRLMITGNFGLLAGIDPYALHEWYLSVYADAYEWVEAPNVIGMSQFADGGLLASKPYAASGNYITKMSDYCSGCAYNVKQKTGDGACPFNALYWDFLNRNSDVLRGNPRLGHPYRTWARMAAEKQSEYLSTARAYLSAMDDPDGRL